MLLLKEIVQLQVKKSKMVRYEDGKIYVIRNTLNDLLYIGSTTIALCKRMTRHRCDSRKDRCKSTKFYRALAELGSEHFFIELLEKYPCETIEELKRYEGEMIRKFDTIRNGYNTVIAGRNSAEYRAEEKEKLKAKRAGPWKAQRAEYYLKHRDEKREKHKVWRESHQEHIKQRSKEYYAANKELIAERRKPYIEANKEKKNLYAESYREANKDLLIARRKKKYQENKEKMKAASQAYREKNREKVLARYKERADCSACGRTMNRSSLERHMKTVHENLSTSQRAPGSTD